MVPWNSGGYDRAMSERILIVEDEAAIADTIQYALETESFESVWVTTGGEAESLVRDGNFDLVILDIGLPDINGFELLKQIRLSSDIPVIFLTARSEEIDRVVGLEIGADDYVTKPFSPRELVARIRVILRRVGNNGGQKKDSGFDVDKAGACVRFVGQKLQLTRAEYLLLTTLLEQPGRVFSRAQLMDRIWEQPHPSDERTIDTHVKSLRAKIRKVASDADPIQTHRGLGYSIDPAKPIGQRISGMTTLKDNAPIDPEREYVVTGWASINQQTEGPPIWQVVENYLGRHSPVRVPPNDSIKVIGA